jgi:hypothetical protein
MRTVEFLKGVALAYLMTVIFGTYCYIEILFVEAGMNSGKATFVVSDFYLANGFCLAIVTVTVLLLLTALGVRSLFSAKD